VDGTTYQAGDDLGAENMVVYAGTGNTVTVPNLAPVYYYFAVYSYAEVEGAPAYNLDSAAGRIEVLGVPSVTSDPVPETLYAGRTAHFTGAAIGTSPLQYQWRKDGVNLSDGASISGATTPALTVANLAAADAGSYTLVVSNEAGSATSNPATLTVLQSGATPYESAVISYQPVAYWRFGEPAGSTVASDYYGGYDGTYNIDDALGVPGPTPADGFSAFTAGNTCVNLLGTDTSYITTPALNLNSANVTIVCWIRPTTSPNNDRAGLYTYTGAHRAGMRFVGTTDKLGSLWYGTVYDSTLAIPASVWSMAAMTVSPTELRLYLGNTAGGLQSQAFSGTFAPEEFNNTGIIGNDSFVAGRTFNGDMDEVAVFNYTLTPAQMQDIYAGVPQVVKPALSATRSGPNVVISWPATASGFSLRTSAKMGPGASWDAVSVAPVVVGGMNTVTLPATAPAAFFQLQK